MKRDLVIGILLVLMFAYNLPVRGASKETIELEEQVKLLETRIQSMQQSFNEKMAALQASSEQTANNVKQISAWAEHVDATLKQQTADSDTCADQLSGNSKVLHEQLEDLRSKLNSVVKQLQLNGTANGVNSGTPPAGTNSPDGKDPRPGDKSPQ